MFEKTKEFGLSHKIKLNGINGNIWASLNLTDSCMKCDTGLDSGFGSLKSTPPIIDSADVKRNQTSFLENCSDAALLNLLTSNDENSWKVDEPPFKILRMDEFSESTQCHSQESSDTHLMSFSNVQNHQEDASQGYLWTRDSLMSEKENQHLRTFTSLNPTLVSEEATLGDYPSQDASPNLDHMQSVLRALIREVGQTTAQEILAKDEHEISQTPLISREAKRKPSCPSSVVNSVSSQRTTVRSLTASNASRRDSTKRPILCTNFPSRSKDGKRELKIISQPEEQHRARYLTEGSRGAVKDREGTGFPEVKLFGCNKPAKLQVFIATDQGKVQPHLFYQASKVCGKNSSSCVQRKIDGTVVLEVDILPEKEMVVSCDFVGILKERNVDVEQRLLHFGGTRNKKRSTKCRLVFRACIPLEENCVEILQVASLPVLCTQPPGVPEVSKKSLSSCSVKGGMELFIIGKNFLKDTKVVFKEVESGSFISKEKNAWEVAVHPDKEYLQPTHLVCSVPSYHDEKITTAATVQLLVKSGGKTSDPQPFTYTPILPAVNEEWIKTVVQEKSIHPLHPSTIISELPADEAVPSVFQLPHVSPQLSSVSNLHQPVSPCVIVIPGSSSAFLTSSSLPPPARVVSTTSDCCNTNNLETNQFQLVVMPHSESSVCGSVQNSETELNEKPLHPSSSNTMDHTHTPPDTISETASYLEAVVSQPFTEGVSSKSLKDIALKNVWKGNLKAEHLTHYIEGPVDRIAQSVHLMPSSDAESRSQEVIHMKPNAEDSIPPSSIVHKDSFIEDFNLSRLNVSTNSTSCDLKNQNLTTKSDISTLPAASEILQPDEISFHGVENKYTTCHEAFRYFCTDHSTLPLPPDSVKKTVSPLNDQFKDNNLSTASNVLKNELRNMSFPNSVTATSFLNGSNDQGKGSVTSLPGVLPVEGNSTTLISEGYSSAVVNDCQVTSSQITESSTVDDISAVSWIPDSELLSMINSSTFDNV